MSGVIPGAEIVAGTERLISAKKQQGAFSLDLTVRSISVVESGGSLDFGGSEYEAASVQLLEPVKKTPDEPYGWWKLGEGSFLLTFNERIALSCGSIIMVLSHERLLAAGSTVTPLAVDTLDESISVLLRVGPRGLAIKENARVCKAVALG